MRNVAWILGLSMACAAAGCSGGDGGENESFSSGVTPSKQGEDVTQNEAEQFCMALDDYRTAQTPSRQTQCRAEGFAAANLYRLLAPSDKELRDACSEAEQSCLEEPNDPDDVDCDVADAPAACTSTIGQIEACVTDKVNQNKARLESLPACSSLTREGIAEIADNPPELPASCETVRTNCLEVYNAIFPFG